MTLHLRGVPVITLLQYSSHIKRLFCLFLGGMHVCYNPHIILHKALYIIILYYIRQLIVNTYWNA